MSGGGRLGVSEWRLGDAWLVIAISYRRKRRETQDKHARAAIAEFYLFGVSLPLLHTSHARP